MEKNIPRETQHWESRTALVSKRLMDRLRKIGRNIADILNSRLAGVQPADLRILLILSSALFGLYCLGLIVGFL